MTPLDQVATYDIIQAILPEFQIHQTSSLHHVRGHQDAAVRSLATSFRQLLSHASESGFKIPGPGCHLVIENQVIPSNHVSISV
jgi:hypothetical protein